MRTFLRVLVVALTGLIACAITGTTGVGAATFTYDGPAIPRVGVHAIDGSEASPARLSDPLEGSASPSAEGRGTSTTPTLRGVATEAGETYYRTMSDAHFAELQSTGRVPATGETFISPTKEFSSAYDGTLVEFNVQPGTTDSLVGVGVRDGSAATANAYPGMPGVSSGWSSTSAFFKAEGAQINIGLGRGPGLDIFNDGIISFRNVPR